MPLTLLEENVWCRIHQSERDEVTPCPEVWSAARVCSQQAGTLWIPHTRMPSSCPWIPVSPAVSTWTYKPLMLQPRSSCGYRLLHTHSWPRLPSSQCRQNRDIPTQERLRKGFNEKAERLHWSIHAQPDLFIRLALSFPTPVPLNRLNPSLFPIFYSFPKHPAKILSNPKMSLLYIP